MRTHCLFWPHASWVLVQGTKQSFRTCSKSCTLLLRFLRPAPYICTMLRGHSCLNLRAQALMRNCMNTCRNMLQDLSPASEVLLPEEDMASIAPMLQVAYGETVHAPGPPRPHV